MMPRLSPDGRWLAYVSDETGQEEVWVRAYPGLDRKTNVSAGYAVQPVWGPAGSSLSNTLYYRSLESLMRVAVGRGDGAGGHASTRASSLASSVPLGCWGKTI